MWGKKKTTKPKKVPASKAPAKATAKKAPTKKVSKPAAAPKPDLIEQASSDIFALYALEEEMGRKVIGSEGIQKLFTDMKLDLASSPEILAFMWHCNCEEYGRITQLEFKNAWIKLQIGSLDDLKKNVPKQLSKVYDNIRADHYRSFYRFVFTYHREGMMKSVKTELCISLFELLFSDKFPLLSKFVTFVNDKQLEYMTLDEWEGVLDLLRDNPENLDNYDVMGAWPSLMDSFYEWSQNN